MTITLIRHAKVNYKFKKSYRHFEFDKSCTEYDNSPVLQEIEHRANSITGNIIYVSSLIRTHETAQLLFSGIMPTENKLFDEVPIKSFAPLPIALPTALWFGMIDISERKVDRLANRNKKWELILIISGIIIFGGLIILGRIW
ncbi:MAG: hypothetical protein FWE07_00585 [Turicibacter sp.]|nr:hypothetical protein [Turicibacter sp.]